MFLHKHPYKPFIEKDTERLIVGTLPPPRFTTGDLQEKDVDFCYGSHHNSLWLYVDAIYKLNLRYDNSKEAITQRKQFLINHKIGICDIVESAVRDKIDASDLEMKAIQLRNLIGFLQEFHSIKTLLFIGGSSKNGPEYFFRRHLKEYDLKLELVEKITPKIHQFMLPSASAKQPERLIKTVSLTSSSGAANISIGSNPLYKQLKAKNPDFNTFDFRVLQYREFI